MLPFKQSIVQENNVIKALPEIIDVDNNKTNIGWVLFESMKNYSDKTFLVESYTGNTLTYKECLKRSIRTALWLKSNNIINNNNEEIVAICSHNQLNAVVPLFAGQMLGLITTTLDPGFSKIEMKHLLNEIKDKVKIIFVSKESINFLEECLDYDVKIVIFGSSNNNNNKSYINFEECLKEHPDENIFEPTCSTSIYNKNMVLFSSGTTGLPKGVFYNNYMFLHQMKLARRHTEQEDLNLPLIMEERTRIKDNTFIVMFSASLYWCSSIYNIIGGCFKGITLVFNKNFHPEHTLDSIEKYKVNLISLLPVQAMAICKSKKLHYTNISTLIRLLIAGAPISKEQMNFVKKSLPKCIVFSCYGQTETLATVLTFDPINKYHKEFLDNKPLSCGLPIPGNSYKIVDCVNGKELEAGKIGELYIKSKCLINNYINSNELRPPITSDDDGWYKTGDEMYYDDDFCFFYVDRIKEMLKYNGHVISPAYIEHELLKHPHVKDVTVIGIPFEEDGDHLMAIVELNENDDDAKKIHSDDLEKYIEKRMDNKFWLRAGVKIVDNIPRTIVGKPNRRILKKIYT